MMKHAFACLTLLCLSASVSLAQETTEDVDSLFGAPDTNASGEEAAIQKMIDAYAAAFNSHDADAVAAHWSEQGVHVVKESGERTEGREAIQADFAKLFEGHPDAAIGVKVDSIRVIKPEVAVVEGVARVGLDDGAPSDTAFTAILLNSGGKWLIDSVHETALPEPPTSADYLDQLGWMVGNWVDDSDEVRVDTNVRWAANDALLIRSYTVQRAGELEHQGTQVIAWCPRTESIRCWMFDSDGSFGEGTWTATDGGWQIDSTLTRSDGRLAKGTQLLKVVDDDTVTVQRTALEVDGEKQPPSDPVRIIRVVD
jgi:uncharacterized protein (TIGR02246 family)